MHRVAWIGMLSASLLLPSEHSVGADEREDFFEAKIRPVLVATCFPCHGGTKTSGALRVDSQVTLLIGGETGPAIVPGQPEKSLLIQAIQRQPDVSAMPPDKDQALRPDQAADFVAWVKAGAVWPAKPTRFETAKHWAFEPIHKVALPAVQDQAWAKTSIDPFIRSKQEAVGVRPAPASDKFKLIRRATFDLTGLPPTPAEIDVFAHDTTPAAFEAVVDRLLESPAYGERWGRHWLDVVRYADTAGETADYPVPLAWRYRNYVIDAFRSDKPYDQFLREQIAGDVLANLGQRERFAERVTATGFLAVSRRFGFDSEHYHHLTIQDTIDTLGQTVLGLSLGCARCHDHKFDPVPMTDYYALYGIFDSSRYAFPGSEQKQRVRSLAPLVPPSEARAKWRDYDAHVSALTSSLAKQEQPAAVVLRGLNDIDGDFELQAPAVGGSNGVLVSPWLYVGKIAVTNAAQSPFKHLYALGRVGVSVPGDAGAYRISQALYPRRTSENGHQLFVNLDFRVSAPEAGATGSHRFSLGAHGAIPAVEILISSAALVLHAGPRSETLGSVQPGAWCNLQLVLDLRSRTVSGRFGDPGTTTEFTDKPFSPDSPGVIGCLTLDAILATGTTLPPIEFDNCGVQDWPIPLVSLEAPADAHAAVEPDANALAEQLQALTGLDGDFELQSEGAPPASPWNPGPNSVVKLSASSQSPYRNIFAPGELGVHLPNRGEYDGFGLTLKDMKLEKDGHVFVSFDFRCADTDAGGDGSWRYYLGHGPGTSAAVELFFNGSQFFCGRGDRTEAVCGLAAGEWHHVQLSLDLNAKSYTGVVVSHSGRRDFTGPLATGWDGQIDYSFIDSYGHLGGVRPALDADNFAVGPEAFPSLEASPVQVSEQLRDVRRAKVAKVREQLAAAQANADSQQKELDSLLAQGPFAMAFGMAEGTPHNAPMQIRGEPDQPGDEIPRGFLKVLGGGTLPATTEGSGRLELAAWLTRFDNPLTARVMVNRIWQHHFGRGLVKTPNDFGARGLAPTHPELLDHLATQFRQSGWSVKSMHRLIMLSATYQQSSLANTESPGSSTDALANLYAVFCRRRLSAEEVRDSILAVSGELDPTPAQEHPFPPPTRWGYTQHSPFSAVYDHNKRSVYLMTQRLKRHPFLALFDGADPNATTAERLTTIVPTQALYFLNDPFVHEKAEKWAARLRAAHSTERQSIVLAFRQALGRSPTEPELTDATEFLATYRAELAGARIEDADARSLAALLRSLLGSNEFLFVD